MIHAMTTKYPLEQLLRIPYERAAAVTYFLACALVLLSPSILMGALHTPSLTWSIAAGLLVRGAMRFWEARKLLRYQYGMHVLPKYEIDSRDIPLSKENLFLGLGFEWTARHTQRRYDFELRSFDYHKYRHQQIGYKIVRAFEKTVRSFNINVNATWPWSPQKAEWPG